MKYIFGFSAKVDIYKKPFNFKITSGDYMIDDITLYESIQVQHREIKNEDYNKFTNYYLSERSQKRWKDKSVFAFTYLDKSGNISEWSDIKTIPLHDKEYGNYLTNKIFVYEIDDKILKDRITFQFANRDTNYTNGFMTKFATIQLLYSFLIPKHLLKLKTLQKMEWRFIPPTEQVKSSIFKARDFYWMWPGTCSTLQEIKDKVKSVKGETPLGGSQKVFLPIVKKHGIHMIGSMPDTAEEVEYSNKLNTGRIHEDAHFYKMMYWYPQLNIENEDIRDNQ